VSLRHVAVQTGTTADAPRSGSVIGRVLEFVGGQVGALGPVLFCFTVLAVIAGFRVSRGPARSSRAARAARLLIALGLPIFFAVGLISLRAKVQVNWPAPAYFTLMILTAWLLANGLFAPAPAPARRGWRSWFAGGVVLPGLLFIPLAHDFSIVYPVIARVHGWFSARPLRMRNIDPTARLRGWRDLGRACGRQLATLGPDAFVLCFDYQQTALTAFYTPGQPTTYYAGSYLGGDYRKRLTQYDMWDSRRLDRPELLGRNAVYVGYVSDDLRAAFARVEEQPELEIRERGVRVRNIRIARCYGFKGMRRPGTGTAF
jgi:hypothetical protein